MHGDIMTQTVDIPERRLGRRMDLTGHTYHRLTVVDFDESRNKWRCRCECGKEHYATANALRMGGVKSCGCAKRGLWKNRPHPMLGSTHPRRMDLVGERFERLTVIAYDHTDDDKRSMWRAKCDCGVEVVVSGHSLARGNTRSCGCLRDEKSADRGRKQLGMVREDYRRKSMDAVGQRYGKLTVRSVTWRDFDTYRVAIADCLCDCGTEVDVRLPDLRGGRIVTCGCGSATSGEEKDVFEYIRSLDPGVKRQQRLGRIVGDIVSAKHRLWIEYHGAYWHSYPRIDRRAHYDRRLMVEAEGYRYIQIWSDDWERRNRQIRAYLRRVFNDGGARIGARMLQVVGVPPLSALCHHNAYHLQSGLPVAAAHHFGLCLDGRLIAVASFDRTGILHRYTVADGFSIPGGLSRLIKAYLEVNPVQRIVTYCDRDYFAGAVYVANGFVNTGWALTMSYVERGQRVRRERYMKHKLPALFGDVDLSLKEIDICAQNNVYACWNSGTDRYELTT